jgi:hypothetical protein
MPVHYDITTVKDPTRLMADFRYGFYCIFTFSLYSSSLGCNIVLLFNSHYIHFGFTHRSCCWTKPKFLVEILCALEIDKDIANLVLDPIHMFRSRRKEIYSKSSKYDMFPFS